MKKLLSAAAFASLVALSFAQELPSSAAVLAALRTANAHFMAEWPDPGKTIVTNRERPSNIWTRAVYYEGLMALYGLDRNPAYLDYAVKWGEFHHWGLRSGERTRNADDQCCGQIYLDLYRLDPKPERIRAIAASLDAMVASDKVDDWSWVDAIQMAMPAFAKLGALTHDAKYFEKAHALYTCTKTRIGGAGLYNPVEHLWWRDKDFVPPYREPNGASCYWSRGNGWVFAALVRVLEEESAAGPATSKSDEGAHRAEYEQTFKEMAAALVPLQRADGFWNASLRDPKNFGGPETSGTALFVYGLAWGIRQKLLDEKIHRPVVARAWQALSTEALRSDGFLRYVQGTGKQPSEGRPVDAAGKPQPIGPEYRPDFDDFGLGCFLLAGSEVARLAGR